MPFEEYKNLYEREDFDPKNYPIAYIYRGIKIHSDCELGEEDLKQLEKRARSLWNVPTNIYVNADGEFFEVGYEVREQAFERIRRITGYLVGTLDRFNDGKRAEEAERVKHRVNQ